MGKTLKEENNLGRLNINPYLGKNENGDYEALYTFGARSFSIWDADNLNLIYDSGYDFEQITGHGFRQNQSALTLGLIHGANFLHKVLVGLRVGCVLVGR